MGEFEKFEWDDAKNLINIDKHDVDFGNATNAFSDPNQITYRSGVDTNESRYICIGLWGEILLAVIFTYRGNKVRIISARKARKNERESYEG
jgi:uncharacterized DUF497 family protein